MFFICKLESAERAVRNFYLTAKFLHTGTFKIVRKNVLCYESLGANADLFKQVGIFNAKAIADFLKL